MGTQPQEVRPAVPLALRLFMALALHPAGGPGDRGVIFHRDGTVTITVEEESPQQIAALLRLLGLPVGTSDIESIAGGAAIAVESEGVRVVHRSSTCTVLGSRGAIAPPGVHAPLLDDVLDALYDRGFDLGYAAGLDRALEEAS